MGEQVLDVKAGQVVVEEGTVGGYMFIVAEGLVEVSRARGDVRVAYGRIGPGGLFGELALLESLPRSATVTAVEDSKLVAVDSAALLSRLADDPMFGLKLLQRLAGRIRVLSDELLERAVEGQTQEDEIRGRLAEIEHEVPGYL